MFQLEALPLVLGQMHLNASWSIPDGITGPGTIHWSGEIKRAWVRVSVQRGLLVFTSRAACLSRFALIKDKGSLIGCRCAALMSITTLNPPFPPYENAPHLHICHSMLCSISLTPSSSSSLPVTHPQTLTRQSDVRDLLFNEIVLLYWYSFPGSLNSIELSKKTSKPRPWGHSRQAKTNAQRNWGKNTVIQMQFGLLEKDRHRRGEG